MSDKQTKISQRYLSGSYTVEASLILPLIIFLYSALIYLTFFLYNRCVAPQEAYLAAFREAVREGVGKYDFQPEESGKSKKTVYIGNDSKNILLEKQSDMYIANLEGSMQAFAVRVFLSEEHLSFSAKQKSFRIDPVQNIRTVRLIKKTAKKLKIG